MEMNIFCKIKNVIIKNKILIILLILSTSFFIYHHYTNIVWDFTSYASNARYWAGAGEYLEPYRPPLISFIILLFSPLGWTAAEYLYIIFVSLLFFYSSIRLANAVGLNKTLFYFLSLSPYVLFFGIWGGTELLSLAMLELFLAFLIEKKSYSGIFLGLACMARYNFFIFIPFLFFSRDIKKILQNVVFFIIAFFPWLAYNFYSTGNFFTSILDNYIFNVKLKLPYPYPIDPFHFNALISYLWPFFVIGIIYIIYNWKVIYSRRFRLSHFIASEKVHLLMLAVLFLSVYQYCINPLKVIRFIFPMVLPVSYFSVMGINKIRQKSKKVFKLSIMAIVLVNLLFAGSVIFSADFEPREQYTEAINLISELGIENCRTMSNAWPIMTYMGKLSEPPPWKEDLLQEKINEGIFIIVFNSPSEFDWETNRTLLRQYPVIHENKDFIVLGNLSKCKPPRKFNFTYMETMFPGKSTGNDMCFLSFEGNDFLERFCNLINLRGFIKHKNDGI